MIPLKLKIKNFLSYGNQLQTIDFQPYQLICLSGKNGHGKSALLDALTWAIWGQARKCSNFAKADEGILRLGADQMVVIADIESKQQVYRIKREFTQINGKSHSFLEFGILDTTTDSVRPLTDKTIKATQEKIGFYIGLSYESFINSAFIKQGQSNEFSKKTAKERKDVLVSILGLDQYEQLKKMACEKMRAAQMQIDNYNKINFHVVQELLYKPNIENSLSEKNAQLSNIKNQEQLAIKEQQAIVLKKDLLDKKKLELNKLDFIHQDLKNKISEKTNFTIDQITAFRQTLYKQINLKQYENIELEKITLEKKLSEIQNSKKIFIENKEKILDAKTQLNSLIANNNKISEIQETTFIKQVNESKLVLKELETKYNQHKLELDNINNLLQKHEHIYFSLQNKINTPESIDKLAKYTEKMKASFNKFLGYINSANLENKNIINKKELINQNLTPECPLCFQNIEKSHKNKIFSNFDNHEKLLIHKINKLKKTNSILHKQVLENQQITNIDNNNLQNFIKLESEIKELKYKQVNLANNISNLTTQISSHNSNLSNFQEQLNTIINIKNSFITTDLQALELNAITKKLELENSTYADNSILENLIILKIEKIKTVINDYIDLANKSILQNQRKQAISLTIKEIKKIKIDKNAVEKQVKELELFLKTQEDLIKWANKETTLKLENLMGLKELEIQRIGALEQQLKSLNEKEKEAQKYKDAIIALEHTVDEYSILSQALSKDGIQALLIENAIPEIEEEANRLLSKLTDNQAHLSIESLRDLKSGTTKETLDIKISDSIGIRPYELFSGGEAFRIDFALRIAISKLLAKRSGTTLQTLIIDEGFGSQDDEGLSHIMDCIHKIKEDFSKVIIVSHLNSIKEQFPVHFLIHKNANGSAIKIMEQG